MSVNSIFFNVLVGLILSCGVLFTAISSALLHYIPQHSPQIWDETPKTRIIFSILPNTCLRVFTFALINNHAALPYFSKQGNLLLKTTK